AAMLVARVQQPPAASGNDALRAAGVDHGGVCAEQHARHRTIAGDPLNCLGRDGHRERHLAGGRSDQALQRLQGRRDLNVRANASMLRNRRGIEAMSGKLNESVGIAVFAAAVIAVAVWLSERFECGSNRRACRGIELALDIQRAVVSVCQAKVPSLCGLTLLVSHAIRIRSVPGVHGVVPEAADAALPGGPEKRSVVKRFRAVRVCYRLGMTRNDGSMRKADAAVSHGCDSFWQVGELFANVKQIGSRT